MYVSGKPEVHETPTTYVKGISDMLQRPESNDLLEEIKRRVPVGGMGKRGHGRRARPRDDRGEEDAENERALDAIQHEEH